MTSSTSPSWAENIGSVDITGITIDDPLLGIVAQPGTDILVGDTYTQVIPYTVTAGDIAAGFVTNDVDFSALAGVIFEQASVTVDLTPPTALLFDKSTLPFVGFWPQW